MQTELFCKSHDKKLRGDLQAAQAAELVLASQKPDVVEPEPEGIPDEQEVNHPEQEEEPEEAAALPEWMGVQEGPPAHNLAVEGDLEDGSLLLPADFPPVIISSEVSTLQLTLPLLAVSLESAFWGWWYGYSCDCLHGRVKSGRQRILHQIVAPPSNCARLTVCACKI